MNYQELDNLITFKMGLPSLYHIMLGMSSDETEDYEKELENKETDNYDLNDFLKKYDVSIERTAFTAEWRLHEISLFISIEHFEEKDAKMLYNYFVYRMNVVEKKFSFTSRTDDTIKDLNISIHTDLYDVIITKETNEENGSERIVILFTSEDEEKLDKLRCLAIIANNETSFADDIWGYMERNNQ